MSQHKHDAARDAVAQSTGEVTLQVNRPTPQRQQRPQGAPWLADWRAFLSGFLAQPRQVASVVPSSVFLERRLVRATGAAAATMIVELGPGTGGTTRALLRAARPDARLLAIELNPMFAERLRHELPDPRLIVQLGSAEQLEEILLARGLPAPDVVASGIPFSNLPTGVAHAVAAAVTRCLAPGGRFVAYQVSGLVSDYATPCLGAPDVSWEWLNVPPVRVYSWRKPDESPLTAPGQADTAAREA